MLSKIIDYHIDAEDHWVARLACGHFQHIRHDPPWISRPWVIDSAGREKMLGLELECKKCERQESVDFSV